MEQFCLFKSGTLIIQREEIQVKKDIRNKGTPKGRSLDNCSSSQIDGDN